MNPFIAIIRRLPNGQGYKTCKNASIPGRHHSGSIVSSLLWRSYVIPADVSVRNAPSYFQNRFWSKRRTSFINYGTNAPRSLSTYYFSTLATATKIPQNSLSRFDDGNEVSEQEFVLLYGNAENNKNLATSSNNSQKQKELSMSRPKNPNKKFTIRDMRRKYESGSPLTMVTAYDFPSARAADRAGIDLVLVGDSVAMVVLGHDSTVPVTVDQMIHHTQAVVRGAKRPFIVADMPFASYLTPDDAVRNAARLIKEGGADAVKLEGGIRVLPQIKSVIDCGIAVIGHIGLTPQSHSAIGGYHLQGKSIEDATALYRDACALQEAGCCAIVIEMVPTQVAEFLTNHIKVPTIGIGSGNGTSGQVLVLHDLIGMYDSLQPKFSKRYVSVGKILQTALESYREEVTLRSFPSPAHSYYVTDNHIAKLAAAVGVQLDSAPAESQSPMQRFIKKVVVIGGGAMGTLVAGRLSSLSYASETPQVWLFTQWDERIQAINHHHSLKIRTHSTQKNWHEEVVNSQLRATNNISEILSDGVPVDAVIVLVKSNATSYAAKQAQLLLQNTPNNDEGIVLSLQNGGTNASVLREIVGEDRTLSGVTYQSATLEGHDLVNHTGQGETIICLPFETAKTPTQQKRLSIITDLARLLNEAGLNTRIVPRSSADHITWRKLIVNSVVNPLTALFRVKNGALLDPRFSGLIRLIVEESVGIANRAVGVADDMEQTVSEVLAAINGTSNNVSSMLSDVLKGKATEISALNGFIVERAQQLGMSAPVNSLLVEAVNALHPRDPSSNTLSGSSSSSSSSSSNNTVGCTTISTLPLVCKTVREIRLLRDEWGSMTVGFVPTMGALHGGHIDLIKQAKSRCSRVVVSIFVNPKQFAPGEDYNKYPRQLEKDINLLSQFGGVDAVFAPDPSELYPNVPNFGTFINIEGIDSKSEGKARPGFFRGVCTVCAKLFNIVKPNTVFFGQKDGLQTIVIKQMVRDLNFPIDVVVVDTVRESTGLAMSSRNVYLSNEERELIAPRLYKSLQAASFACGNGEVTRVGEVKNIVSAWLAKHSPEMEIQYVSVADTLTADELSDDVRISRPCMLSVAVKLGKVRLIDNLILHPNPH